MSQIDGGEGAEPSDKLTALERQIASIWSESLHIPRITPEDNFFDIGGHSLGAAEVAARMRELICVDVTIKDLYENVTLRELADFLQNESKGLNRPLENDGAGTVP